MIQKDKSATLATNNDQYLFQPVVYESHPQDSRIKECGEVSPSVTVKFAKGTADTPLVCKPIPIAYTLEPGIAAREGGHVYEGVSGTLRSEAGDNRMAVAYGISSYESNSMKSSNPHSGIYEADTSRTLDLNGGNPACNQGGIAVVEQIGLIDSIGGQAERVWEGDVAPCLKATHYKSPPR